MIPESVLVDVRSRSNIEKIEDESMRRSILIFAAFSLAHFAFAEAPAFLADTNSAVKQLREWTQRVSSFDGGYEYVRVVSSDEEKAPSGAALYYRYKTNFKGDRYVQHLLKPEVELVEVLLQDSYSYRLDRPQEDPQMKGEVFLDERTGWPYPPGTELFPDDIMLLRILGHPLDDIIASGSWQLLSRNGEIYLACEKPKGANSGSFNCFFFPNGDVSEIEICHVFGTAGPKRAELAAKLGLPEDELREIQGRISFSNYVEIDGVRYPASVRVTNYDNLEASAAGRDFRDGRIDSVEYVRRMLEGAKSAVILSEREVRLDIANTRLNVPLADADFTVPYGEYDYVVMNGSKNGNLPVHILPWHKALIAGVKDFLASLSMAAWIGIASGAGVLLSMALIYRRKRVSSLAG